MRVVMRARDLSPPSEGAVCLVLVIVLEFRYRNSVIIRSKPIIRGDEKKKRPTKFVTPDLTDT